jgi:hypothetical protein
MKFWRLLARCAALTQVMTPGIISMTTDMHTAITKMVTHMTTIMTERN